jgi:hypothetical protein
MADIKVNTLINRIERLEFKIDALIRFLIPEELDRIESESESESNLNLSGLSESDLIEWFVKFLQKSGIDPTHRDYKARITSIRHFYKRFSTIRSPVKYAKTFLPPQRKPPEAEPETDSILDVPRKEIETRKSQLTEPIIAEILRRHPMYEKLKTGSSFASAISTEFKCNIFTALAIKEGLLS